MEEHLKTFNELTQEQVVDFILFRNDYCIEDAELKNLKLLDMVVIDHLKEECLVELKAIEEIISKIETLF